MAYEKKYNPYRSASWNYGGSNWKLSRSKIDLFLECKRCFWLDNKFGTSRPRGPAFTLNIAVDELFKKEFDNYRKKQKSHPLMEKYKVDAVPYSHNKIDEWRDNFVGLQHFHEPTDMTVSGAVDDIWINSDEQLIVVDYKATSKEGIIESLADSSWEEQYKRQIGVYQWLLEKNGFIVSKTGYFVYANALKDRDEFSDLLNFETTLVPCEGENSWIEDTLMEIKATLDSEEIPQTGERCEYCPYREATGKTLLKQHTKAKKA